MLIEDGAGSGYKAKVGTDNRLKTVAITASAEHHVNHADGEAYVAVFASNPAGAGDVLFYLKNNGDTDMVIEGVTWQTSAAEEVYYKIDDSGTPGGTSDTLVPANLNAGSGNVADATCLGTIADGAVDITGLSGGRIVESLYLTSATSEHFNLEQDLIIPKNKTFTIYCVGGDTLLRGTVYFNFHGSL